MALTNTGCTGEGGRRGLNGGDGKFLLTTRRLRKKAMGSDGLDRKAKKKRSILLWNTSGEMGLERRESTRVTPALGKFVWQLS